MPFAAQAGLVSREFQGFAKRQHVFVEKFNALAAISWVKPCQQTGARRGAFGVVVKIRELHSFAADPVDIWRRDFAAVAADVRPAHVIRHDQDDIWLVCRPRGEGGREENDESEKSNHGEPILEGEFQ